MVQSVSTMQHVNENPMVHIHVNVLDNGQVPIVQQVSSYLLSKPRID